MKKTMFFLIIFSCTVCFADMPGPNLYNMAENKLTDIPKNFPKITENVLKQGNPVNEKIRKLIVKNEEALNAFKDAIKEKNSGYAFGKKPEQINISSKMPNYSNKFKLFRLLLLEGHLYESKRQFSKAANDYLTATKFLYRLSQQKYGILFTKFVQIICFDMLKPTIEKTLKSKYFDKGYYDDLKDNLLLLKRNQDALEAAFQEEKEVFKQTVGLMSATAKREGYYKKEFFQKLYDTFNPEMERQYGYLIRAAKSNNLEFAEEKLAELRKEIDKELRPLSISFDTAKTMLNHPTNLSSPSIASKMLLLLAVPKFKKSITYYYISDAKLNVVLSAVGLKLYRIEKGKLPETLEELVPDELPNLPQDPFNNFEPLRYRKKGENYVIYSVGPDKQDDEGSVPFDPLKYSGDIVFSG